MCTLFFVTRLTSLFRPCAVTMCFYLYYYYISYVRPKHKKSLMGVLWPPLTKNFSILWPGRKKAYSTEFGRGGIKSIFTIPYTERPKIRRPNYSQNLLDCRPNDARYDFLRPGKIQLANFRAAGRIKDIVFCFSIDISSLLRFIPLFEYFPCVAFKFILCFILF